MAKIKQIDIKVSDTASPKASEIDWYYHRSGCATCKRAKEFLAPKGIPIKELVSADNERLSPDQALALAHKASEIWVTRGKKLIHYDMKRQPPATKELLDNIIGPSGYLRAPTIVTGGRVLIGFHQEAFSQVFG